mmetsp:Transcript_26436/g.56113  ORF Transcript_26436/g.56113 Transcript_26436/m.56113 type:complete len:219 (-) Transcript_26436:357-1013(-)
MLCEGRCLLPVPAPVLPNHGVGVEILKALAAAPWCCGAAPTWCGTSWPWPLRPRLLFGCQGCCCARRERGRDGCRGRHPGPAAARDRRKARARAGGGAGAPCGPLLRFWPWCVLSCGEHTCPRGNIASALETPDAGGLCDVGLELQLLCLSDAGGREHGRVRVLGRRQRRHRLFRRRHRRYGLAHPALVALAPTARTHLSGDPSLADAPALIAALGQR